MTLPAVVPLPSAAGPQPSAPSATPAPGSQPTRRGNPAATALARARPPLALLGWLYLSATASLLGWVALSTLALGWRPVVVTSASMEPAIRRGDVVMVAPRPAERLAAGTVVLFDDADSGGLTMHRVFAAEADGSYRTKGDANRTEDSRRLPPEHVVGVGRMLVPLIGLPLAWWQGDQFAVVFAWGLLTALAVLSTRASPRLRRAGPDSGGED